MAAVMEAAQQASLAASLRSRAELSSPRLAAASFCSLGRRKSLEGRPEFANPNLPTTMKSTGGLDITGSGPPSEVRPQGGQRRNSFERQLFDQHVPDRETSKVQGGSRRTSFSKQLSDQMQGGQRRNSFERQLYDQHVPDRETSKVQGGSRLTSFSKQLSVQTQGGQRRNSFERQPSDQHVPDMDSELPATQSPGAGKSTRRCLGQRSAVIAGASAILAGGHEPPSSSSGSAAVGVRDGADAAGASLSDALSRSSSPRKELAASRSSLVTCGELRTNMSTSLDAKGGSSGGKDDSGKHDCASNGQSSDREIQESSSGHADSLMLEVQLARYCEQAAASKVQTFQNHACTEMEGSGALGDALTDYISGGSACSSQSGQLVSGAPVTGMQRDLDVEDQTVDEDNGFATDGISDTSPRELAWCWQEVRLGRKADGDGGPTRQRRRKGAGDGSVSPRAARPRRKSLTKLRTVVADEFLRPPSDEVEIEDDISDERIEGFIEEMFAQYCTAKDKKGIPLLNGAGVRSFFIDFTVVEGGKAVALADMFYAEELERQIDLNSVFELSKADAGRGLCFKAFQCLLDQAMPRLTSRKIARSHFHTYAGSATDMRAHLSNDRAGT